MCDPHKYNKPIKHGIFRMIDDGKKGDLVMMKSDPNESLVTKLTSTHSIDWIETSQGSQNAFILNITTDQHNNSYIIGKYKNHLQLGLSNLISPNYGLFMAKINSVGQWLSILKLADFKEYDDVTKAFITLDNNNHLHLAIGFNQNFTLNPLIIDNLDPNSLTIRDSTILILRITATGFLNRLNILRGIDNTNFSFVTDKLGFHYIFGSYDKDALIGEKLLKTSHYGFYIAKLDPHGNWLWIKDGSVNKISIGLDLTVGSNYLFITGSFIGSWSFGKIQINASSLYSNIFLVALDLNGNLLWFKSGQIDPSVLISSSVCNLITAESITSDFLDNIYITGSIQGTAKIVDNRSSDSISITNPTLSIFIIKLNVMGDINWIKIPNLTPPLNNQLINPHIISDRYGYIYLFGFFHHLAQFDHLSFSSDTALSSFIVELDPCGNFNWGYSYPSSIDIDFNPFSIDQHSNLYFIGHFTNLLTLDHYSIIGSSHLNFFVSKINHRLPNLIGVLSEDCHHNNIVCVDFFGCSHSFTNLNPGSDYYITSRCHLTTNPIGARYFGTAYSSNMLIIK